MAESIIRRAYYGSDGQLTLRACDALLQSGPNGELAVLLFKAMKASARAKKYHGKHKETGTSYRQLSYDRKGQALQRLCDYLVACEADAECWGWGMDRNTDGPHKHVLYVWTDYGQCSFHSAARYKGPNFRGKWISGVGSEETILRYCELILKDATEELEPDVASHMDAIARQGTIF
jgi:hypothetical protein